MKEVLFEIGTEEIPSGYIAPAAAALRDSFKETLTELGVEFGDVTAYATPRRLAVSALDVPATQPKRTTKVFGPPKKAAFGPDGAPSKAGMGFAKSKGVGPENLRVENTDKGEYVYVEVEEGGGMTVDLLAEALPRLALALPFPKSMRWGSSDIKFTRPIHWIVALYGGEVIPFSVDHIRSGSVTRGHRFLGSQNVEVSCREDYIRKLRDNFVIADMAEREKAALEGAREAARKGGGTLLEDGELASTVACLTEWPVAMWGQFDENFLELPDELLIASMKNHQRMFSVKGNDGNLLNGFVGVSNMKVEDDKVVISGYRRVLRARLSDAKFFFDEDRKKPLESFAEKLSAVVYQKKLGTVGEKIERFTNLALYLAGKIDPSAQKTVERTARLCKADLETLMVYEFPELQGVMGREYARHAGEPAEVCDAIFEHYMPRWSGDATPPSDAGAIVGIADKLDTLAGCFAVGLIPTGAADPFALRRNALGVIQTMFDKQYDLSLAESLDFALNQLGGKVEGTRDEVRGKLTEFFAGRLKNYWTGRGVPYDVADAVIEAGFDDLAAARLRCEAMAELKKRDFFEALAITFKRAGNITKGHVAGAVDEGLLENDVEKDLHAAVEGIRAEVEAMIGEKKYLEALERVAGLREKVDKFFDDVMVMVDDEKIRNNRLDLLGNLTGLFLRIADFSRLVT